MDCLHLQINNNVFSLILVTAARNKFTGLGRSTASAVLPILVIALILGMFLLHLYIDSAFCFNIFAWLLKRYLLWLRQ